MNVKFLDLQAQYPLIREEVERKFEDIIDNTAFVSGKYVQGFEDAYAKYCGVKHCIAVNSGTTALELALRAIDVGPEDEVVIPVNTFIATAEAVSLCGAKPVFVDIEPDTYLIDVDKIEKVITNRTKAIIPVHLYGQMADMDTVNKIAKEYNLIVIEDACQAHGATYKKKRAGSLGDMAAFSFYPGKNLGAWGEGGAVTTNSEKLAEKIRLLRDHGSPEKYVHKVIGGNFRMDEFQGAVLGTKLNYLDEWNQQRRDKAFLYIEKLTKHSGVKPPQIADENSSVWHLFVIQVEERNELRKFLSEEGVQTGIHYPAPLHKAEAYARLGYNKKKFPIAEKISKRILSLPMYPELSDESISYVIQKICSYAK